jgi:hypothetical protein
MEMVYDVSANARTATDAAMSVRPGLSRAEAVEEYLSDYAAVLETSLVARIWNAVKGALNKLGVRTGDEMVRYLLDQARRYARNPGGTTFDAEAVARRLHEVETSGDTGRFSVGPSLRADNIMLGLKVDDIGGYPGSLDEALDYLKGKGVNLSERMDRIKATFLSLANFRARQNPGALGLEQLLEEARNESMSLKVEFNERLREVLSRALVGNFGGVSKAQVAKIGEMIYAAQRAAAARLAQNPKLGNVPLLRTVNGQLVPNQPEIDRLVRLGQRTFEEMRTGFEYNVTFEEAGKTVTKTEKFPGVKGLTKDSIEWRGYLMLRETVNDVELRLLRARYEAMAQERDLAVRQMASVMADQTLTPTERATLDRLTKLYSDMYLKSPRETDEGVVMLDPDQQTYANDVLVASNSALIGEGTDRFVALRKLLTEPRRFMKPDSDTDVRRELPPVMEGQMADDLIVQLKALRSRMNAKNNKYAVQSKIKQVVMAEFANLGADHGTKVTLATGYTPILREGKYQTRVEARVGGRVVRMQDSYREQLVYSQFDTASEAMEMERMLNGAFKGRAYPARYYDSTTNEYVTGDVQLVAVSGAALDAIAAPPQLNLNEFVRGLRQFDIALDPRKMEEVIVALTRQNSSARNRLLRAFTPGAKLDGIAAVSRHVESRASTIAKIKVRPRLAELMDRSMASTMSLWEADLRRPDGSSHLDWLKAQADKAAQDPNLPREVKDDARREYELYAYMANQTNPEGRPARGNQFYNEAARTVAFLEGNQDVNESDFGNGPVASDVRAYTSLMQLGGSIATGALNVLSLYTNGIPYLSSYNAKTAFGGGFSMGKVTVELHRAMAQVGATGVVSREANTAEYYRKVAREVRADRAMERKYGLKAHEAEFIARQILNGAMIPAQFNALAGTSRGRATSGAKQQLFDKWMVFFNVSEQASRRSLGLTAYRLEYARQKAVGRTDEQAIERAQNFAVGTLQFTMGEYSVLNRPPAWRSGIQSFLYMYKVFPTTSIQLLANMDNKGRAMMLAGMFLLTGLAGLPFAENLEDVVDTLAQKLKMPGWQGARYETAQLLEELAPGYSALLIRGVTNNFITPDIASRTSLAKPFPGTEILLAGSNVGRGLLEIAGPAASMLQGSAQFATDVLSLPFSDTTTIESTARAAPVTMIRALGDAYAYTQSGAVVDRRGYVVTDDMHMGTIISRLLGFYPSAAANQYEIIRSAKRMTDYQREVVTGYRTAWVTAMMRNDREMARQLEESVREWNAASKGTALEIRNFVPNSQRALREARRPAAERTLRTAPDAAERDLRQLVDLLSLN